MKILGVDAVQMDKYIDAEVATLPPGTDAILHFSPEEAQRRVASRHELAMAQAKNAELSALLEQKTARDARTAKQSVQPARRVAGDGSMTILQQTEADLGIDPDWGNVQGFGHRGAHD